MDWLDRVIETEGGYVNDPTDKGGETKYGIAKKYFPHLDIKNLTKEQAKEIYSEMYVIPSKAHLLPSHLQYIHFDTAVNMGVSGAARMLQRAAGVKEDGIIGKVTLEAAKSVSVERYLLFRAFRYMSIIDRSHDQAKFSKGWANRLKELI